MTNEATLSKSVRGARILLTGGAGFIGSHLGKSLIAGGANLTVVDNFDDFYDPERKRANISELTKVGSLTLFEADICAARAMEEVYEATRPDIVVHLAAKAGVRPSLERPQEYERVNVSGTLNLLELARKFKVGRFVFGSSSSVYGASSRAPFSETQLALRPVSPYAATKLAGEIFCYTYAHLYGLPTVCLRFFTVYGPKQRPDLAIHKFTALMTRGQPIPIFDPASGRDYTHVSDIVRGMLAAMTYSMDQSQAALYDVFNLGNSHPVTLIQLVQMIEKLTGLKAVFDEKGRQPGDVPLTWADIKKAGQMLGYAPSMRLEEGLRDFLAWYRSSNDQVDICC